jgi:hypothetical protein
MVNRADRRARRAEVQAAMTKWENEEYPLLQFEAEVFRFSRELMRCYEEEPLPLRYSRRNLVRRWIDLAKDWPEEAFGPLSHYVIGRCGRGGWYSWNVGQSAVTYAEARIEYARRVR